MEKHYACGSLVRKILQAPRQATDNAMAATILPILGSVLATHLLGIHLLFGAFLCGSIMPKSPDFAAHLKDKIRVCDGGLAFAALLRLFRTAHQPSG